MPGPRRLVDWPWVVLRVECEPCRYGAAYRIVRLAEKYGAEADLAELLERVRAKCRLIDRGHRRREPAMACAIRYRVPAGGPLPEGVEAREERRGDPWPPRPRRLRYDGPLPTIGAALAEGCTSVLVYCAGRGRNGHRCHHQGSVDIDDLALPLDWPFIRIATSRRLCCSRCGSRDVEVRSDRPDRHEAEARAAGAVPMRELNGVWVPCYTDPSPPPATQKPAVPFIPDPSTYAMVEKDDGTYAVTWAGMGKVPEMDGSPQRGLMVDRADDAANLLEAPNRIVAQRGARMDG